MTPADDDGIVTDDFVSLPHPRGPKASRKVPARRALMPPRTPGGGDGRRRAGPVRGRRSRRRRSVMSMSPTGPSEPAHARRRCVAALIAAVVGRPPRPRPPRRPRGPATRARCAGRSRGADVRTGRPPTAGPPRAHPRPRAARPRSRACPSRLTGGGLAAATGLQPAQADAGQQVATATARVTDLRLVPLPGQIPAPPIPAGPGEPLDPRRRPSTSPRRSRRSSRRPRSCSPSRRRRAARPAAAPAAGPR